MIYIYCMETINTKEFQCHECEDEKYIKVSLAPDESIIKKCPFCLEDNYDNNQEDTFVQTNASDTRDTRSN